MIAVKPMPALPMKKAAVDVVRRARHLHDAGQSGEATGDEKDQSR